MRVEVVPYDPEWPATFAAIEEAIRAALSGLSFVGIEHVGSTAVVGLAAKPIIDVDIIVALDDVDAAIKALEGAGYSYRGEMGIADRHAFYAPADAPVQHTYVVVDGCLSLRNHLAVREVLRTNDDLRERYGHQKLELAATEWESIDTYTEAKSALLQEVLASGDLTDAELREISEANAAP